MKKLDIIAIFTLLILFQLSLKTARAIEMEIKPQAENSVIQTVNTPQPESPAVDTVDTPQKSNKSTSIGREIIESFSWRFNILAFEVGRESETSSILNQNNRQNIFRYQAEVDIRPDFDLDLRHIQLSAKPRWTLKYEKWTEGLKADEHKTTDELFVNEWLARIMVTDELFVSYGRENLQWGPSYLISPSNPFIKDNGRDNPKTEVSGLDYGRLIWIPHYNWSASLIANTDEGRQDFFNEFEKTYALKIDYTGYQKYFSLIPSHRESEGDKLGFFAGWSISDALLLYGEGSILRESVENDSTDLDLLFGASYTFEMGPTLAGEYFYNDNGVTGPIHKALPPLGTASPDDVLIRRNYGFLQLSDSNIRNYFNYVLRWIQNLDDHSSRAIGILEYEIGDHYKIITIGDFSAGDTDDEFGSLNDYSVYLGVELTY